MAYAVSIAKLTNPARVDWALGTPPSQPNQSGLAATIDRTQSPGARRPSKVFASRKPFDY